MLTNDATILKIKHEVLYQVAKLAYAGEFDEKKDELAYKFRGRSRSFAAASIRKEKSSARE